MSNGGSIITIASIAHAKGFPGYGAYSATKAAVRSFLRTWTAELMGRGIRVNVSARVRSILLSWTCRHLPRRALTKFVPACGSRSV
jgi:NADP-dependent 3-hydroxy acid dehydrogenase YdfG